MNTSSFRRRTGRCRKFGGRFRRPSSRQRAHLVLSGRATLQIAAPRHCFGVGRHHRKRRDRCRCRRRCRRERRRRKHLPASFGRLTSNTLDREVSGTCSLTTAVAITLLQAQQVNRQVGVRRWWRRRRGRCRTRPIGRPNPQGGVGQANFWRQNLRFGCSGRALRAI